MNGFSPNPLIAVVHAATTTTTADFGYSMGLGEIEAILNYAKMIFSSFSPLIFAIIGIFLAFMIIRVLLALTGPSLGPERPEEEKKVIKLEDDPTFFGNKPFKEWPEKAKKQFEDRIDNDYF